MWTQVWPTKEGMYWFYGQQYAREEPELYFVKVWKATNAMVCVCEGQFLYKSQVGSIAWFMPIDAPEPPQYIR